jgi:O-antigen/teichoic acid export membrane protein
LNTLLIVFGGAGAYVAIGVFVGVTVLKALGMLVVVLARGDLTRGRDAAEEMEEAAEEEEARPRDIFLFGLRGYPNALAALLWTRLPVFILGALQGADAVGIFAVSQQLLEQLLLPVQAVQDAIYPLISRSPRATATALLNRSVRVTLWGLLPVLLLVGATAPWSVPFVFGATYGRSTAVFQILLAGAGLTAIAALLSPYFLGQLLRPGTLSALAWVKLLIAAAVSALLATRLAETGVALALVGADAVTTSITVGLYVRAVRTPLTQLLLVQADDLARIVSRCAAQAHSAKAALRLRPVRTRA